MKIIICTFGTRGDVQPFVGLSIALKAAGHHPIIATSPQFRSFVEEYGIQWADLHTPDPKAAFAVCVSKGFFTLKFLRKVRELFSPMIREVGMTLVKLVEEQKPDIVCCTFSTIYVGIHIKEKFNIPAVILSYVPVGPTKYFFSSYAHKLFQASAVKPNKRNLYSHQLIDLMYGRLTQPMMGQFRKEIGLPNIGGFSSWKTLKEAPVLTCYSPALLPPPPDWPTTHRQVGYWWLPTTDLTTLDQRTKNTITAVQRFIDAGKKGNGVKDLPIYIGFGSVPITEPGQVERITKLVLDAIKLTGYRAVIATGWGAIELPSTIDTAKGQKMWLSDSSVKRSSRSGNDNVAVDGDALTNQSNATAHALSQRNSSESSNNENRGSEEKTDNESDTETDSPVEEDAVAASDAGNKSPNGIAHPGNSNSIGNGTQFDVPDNVFVLDAIPHDWMFAADKLQVIVHHGGAGTTGAALKAGVPSVICPFFGDHFLWSHRLWEIGAGPKSLPHHRLQAQKLAARILSAATTDSMRIKCKEIADAILQEDGLQDGVRAFEELAANGGKWKTATATQGASSASKNQHQYQSATAALHPTQQQTISVQ